MTRRHDLRAWTRAAGGHRLTPRDHELLLILGTYTDAETLMCWPGVQRLMADCQCAKSTLHASLGRLIAHGLISRGNHPARAGKLTRLHADAIVLQPDPTECAECAAAARTNRKAGQDELGQEADGGSEDSDPTSGITATSEYPDVTRSEDSDPGGPEARTEGSKSSDPEVEVDLEIERERGTRARAGAADAARDADPERAADAARDADPEWRWRADAEAFVTRHREHLAGDGGDANEAYLVVRRAGLTPSVLDLQALLDGGAVRFGEGMVAS